MAPRNVMPSLFVCTFEKGGCLQSTVYSPFFLLLFALLLAFLLLFALLLAFLLLFALLLAFRLLFAGCTIFFFAFLLLVTFLFTLGLLLALLLWTLSAYSKERTQEHG